MKHPPVSPPVALRLAAVLVLLAGLLSAGVVYVMADEATEDPWTQQIQNSKLYRRDLEIYGGKLNVVGADLGQWFTGLWHGRTLAFTIVALTGGASLVLAVVASQMPPAPAVTAGVRPS